MPAPPNMRPKPSAIFLGEKGFALLECVADSYENRGKVTGCRYAFVEGQRRYVDVRDLSGMDRGSVRKVGDGAGIVQEGGPQETPELVGDS